MYECISDIKTGDIFDCYVNDETSYGMLYLIVSTWALGSFIALNLKTMNFLELVIYKRDVLVARVNEEEQR